MSVRAISARCDGPPIHVVLPGPRATPTGGFVYDDRIIAGLAARGRLGSVIELPDRFPDPDPATLEQARQALDALADGSLVVVDGLALTPLRAVIEPSSRRLVLIGLVHHPLCDETGLSAPRRQALRVAERDALALVHHVIVPSRTTAARLRAFQVTADRITVVHPGIDRPPGGVRRRRPARQAGDRSPRLLAVGSLVPRKGYDRLLASLSALRRHRWRLDVAGPERDRRHAARLRALTARLGLASRVFWHGAVGAAMLDRLYQRADLFVLASRYEGFGIVLIEAAAYGLPALASRAGAIAEAAAGSGTWLVPPDHPRAFAAALERLIVDDSARRRLALRARAARSSTWEDACSSFVSAVDRARDR